MATVSAERSDQPGHSYLHTILTMVNGDVSEAIRIPGAADRTVQVTGTLGTGGILLIEGSNEPTPTVWATLTDFQDADISFDALGIKIVAEAPLWLRARVSAGDGSTSFNVYIFSRGT